MITTEADIKRIERTKKLEHIALYYEWEERCVEELHWTWEEWIKVRQLRKNSEKRRQVFSSPTTQDYLYTIYNKKIYRPYGFSDEKHKEYITTLNQEYFDLNKYSTDILLLHYKTRNRHYANTLTFEGKYYHSESFKAVLNKREHIQWKNNKPVLSGKKDKKHGRLNPKK